ncbi:hypothetical protein AAHA92_00030 [Salvia divinorum]|uniref:Uncharacterized protein n=1 Tax=Salvia divinorum TaxID=28513 RepID=A0ABD1II82_SALDI
MRAIPSTVNVLSHVLGSKEFLSNLSTYSDKLMLGKGVYFSLVSSPIPLPKFSLALRRQASSFHRRSPPPSLLFPPPLSTFPHRRTQSNTKPPCSVAALHFSPPLISLKLREMARGASIGRSTSLSNDPPPHEMARGAYVLTI